MNSVLIALAALALAALARQAAAREQKEPVPVPAENRREPRRKDETEN